MAHALEAAAALDELRGGASGDALHLNNAGVAPMCARAIAAGQRVVERMSGGSLAIPEAIKEYDAARGVFGKLVSAAREDVAFFHTCAAAISQAAFGVAIASGDEILIADEEYPSNAYPWYRAAERASASVRTAPVDRMLESITPRTRVVAVSWVQYGTGASVDLRALADAVHKNGGVLVVDAIQGIGVIPFSLADCGADIICGGTHKWCLGPVGHGFLACAPGVAAKMAPLLVGAMTYGTSEDLTDPARAPRPDARRFEPGSPFLFGAIAGAAAIELLLSVGIDVVQREALALRALLVDGARARGVTVVDQRGPARSPIVTLVPRKRSAKDVVTEMRARRCSVAPRGGGVRVAPHVHNTPAHIERFFALWDELDR